MNHLRAHFAALLALALAVSQIVAEETKLPGEQVGNGRVARVNDIDMYYEVHGQGPPLVLLHGFFGTGHWQWKAFLPDLAREYQLIVPDLRGHGRSTNPSGQFTHRQVANDVFALLDAMGIKRFRTFGVSSGAQASLHMATQQPERVEAMVLGGGTSYWPTEARSIFASITYDGLAGIDNETWQTVRALHGDDKLRSLVDQFRGFKDSYEDVNFTPPFLATIQARTLIVHGDRDAGSPVSIPVDLYRCIPNSYLWIVPNRGHVPFFDNSPRIEQERKMFTDTVLDFLRGDWEKNNKPR